VFSVAALLLWIALERSSWRWAAAFGAVLGLAVALRPFNVGVVAGAVVGLAASRRVRWALLVGVTSVAAFGALAAIPTALGAGLRTRESGATVASGHVFGFAPLTPVRMLFSDHRGLFVWTPVAFLGVVGVVLYLYRRDSPRRLYVALLAAMAAGLLLIHGSLLWWDGGWSFSMRYLASPVVLYAIGLGTLLTSTRSRLLAAIVVVCTLWSVFLGMSHAFGASQSDGAVEVATVRGPTAFVHLTWSYSRVRHVLP
jgi:hypothetical protein